MDWRYTTQIGSGNEFLSGVVRADTIDVATLRALDESLDVLGNVAMSVSVSPIVSEFVRRTDSNAPYDFVDTSWDLQ